MEGLLAAVEQSALATHLRFSRWTYAGVNTAHVLGVALTLGAVVPLNLRLLGFWRSVPLAGLARVLVPAAGFGLALALAAGLLLFSVRASEYGALTLLQVKLLLVALGTVSALRLHARHGMRLEDASAGARRLHALVSLVSWTGALVCGRLIAFVAG